MPKAKAAPSSPSAGWPAAHVSMWPIGNLTPYANNAKEHPEEQVDAIVRSITEFGFTIPVLAAEDGTIIAGHGRVLAAKKMGLPEVPVMLASGWSEEQRRAYTIADNKLTEQGLWDEALLQIELADLQSAGFDIGLTGITATDLDRLLEFAGTEGETDEDDVPPVPKVAVSRPGDVWILGHHRIICGDSTDKNVHKKLLKGAKPNLMVTDPPYGVEYDPSWRQKAGVGSKGAAVGKVLNDDRADWREVWDLFEGSVAYVWHGGLHSATVAGSLLTAGFQLRAQIIWVKTRHALSRGAYHWQHEPAWYGVRPEGQEDWHFVPEHEVAEYAVREGDTADWTGDRKQSTVWFIEHLRSDTGHGTQKPVECMKRPMINNSAPGDAIFEPFSGSGTSIIAAEMCGRRCFAIELSEIYVDLAVTRWQNFTGKTAVLEATGEGLADVARSRGVALADAA